MFNFFNQGKLIFSTVIEERTEELFRATQVKKVAVRILWYGGNNYIAQVGQEKIDALLVADYYGLDLSELAQRYNDNQERTYVLTEAQAHSKHLDAEQKKELQPA